MSVTPSVSIPNTIHDGDFIDADPVMDNFVALRDHSNNHSHTELSQILVGAVAPEGAVTAPAGTVYIRTSGGTSTTFYLKETGAGNTGWQAVYGKATIDSLISGLRILTGSADPAGAVSADPGTLYLRTTGGTSTTLYIKETGTASTAGWQAVYGKAAIDALLALKAPLASPALSGTPTAPTAAVGTNTTQIATTAFVDSALTVVDIRAFGAIGDGSNDDALAMQAAINSLPDGGTVVIPPGVWTWKSVPGLPRNLSSRLIIRGSGGAVIKLTSTGPRAFDFNKIADHDTFQNLELRNFDVDANSIGGLHHIVLGTYINGTTTTRINLAHIAIGQIRVVNALVDSNTGTNHRLGVWLVVRQAAANEATQNSITDVLIEDYWQQGGNAAIAVNGSGGSGNGPDLNVLVDNVTIDRWYHSLISVPSVSFPSSHVQVGSRAKGGPIGCRVSNGYGEYSGDVGVEIDQINCVVTKNVIRDSRNAHFLFTQFNNPDQGAGTQIYDVYNNSAIVISALTTYHAFSFRTASQTTPCPFGTVRMRDNSLLHNQAAMPGQAAAIMRDDTGAVAAGTLRTSFECERFTAYFRGINYASATSVTRAPIGISPTTAGYNRVVLKEIDVRWSGTSTGGATLSLPAVEVYGTALDVSIDGVRSDYLGFTGLGTNGARILELGLAAASTLVGQAVIRNCKFLDVGDSSAGFGINLSSSNLTVGANQSILIENCDFSKMAGGTEVAFNTGTKAKVYFNRNNWRIYPNTPKNVTTNYTVVYPQDETILADATSGAFTVTLLDATQTPKGRMFIIKRISVGSNNVTIATTSSQTIDGATTYVMTTPNQSITVVSDGANWQIL
jgi:hypothetical protein